MLNTHVMGVFATESAKQWKIRTMESEVLSIKWLKCNKSKLVEV